MRMIKMHFRNHSLNDIFRSMKKLISMSGVACCLFLPLFPVQPLHAQGAKSVPIKNLRHASKLIHWPKGFAPQEADVFVHNEISINAPASVIWQNLIEATLWPTWYSNSADVRILGPNKSILQGNSDFAWKTFGFPIKSQIHEFVPNTRIGWFGDGFKIRAYHTWLIIPKSGGCNVVTEETQNGPSAVSFNTQQPTAMYDGHELWLTALKFRAEHASNQ